MQSSTVSTIHVSVPPPLHVTTTAARPRLPWCWAPAKMSISQVVAGYFSRDGRGAAAAPGHWKITYHASSALASADPLLLSWSCSPHRSTVWRSHSIPDTRTMSPLALLLVLGAASCSAQAATSAKLQSLLGNTGAKCWVVLSNARSLHTSSPQTGRRTWTTPSTGRRRSCPSWCSPPGGPSPWPLDGVSSWCLATEV